MQLSLDKAMGFGWVKWGIVLVLLLLITVTLTQCGGKVLDKAETAGAHTGFNTAVGKLNESAENIDKKVSTHAKQTNETVKNLNDDSLNSRTFSMFGFEPTKPTTSSAKPPSSSSAIVPTVGENASTEARYKITGPIQSTVTRMGVKPGNKTTKLYENVPQTWYGELDTKSIDKPIANCNAPRELFDGCYLTGLELLQEGCPGIVWECVNDVWQPCTKDCF